MVVRANKSSRSPDGLRPYFRRPGEMLGPGRTLISARGSLRFVSERQMGELWQYLGRAQEERIDGLGVN